MSNFLKLHERLIIVICGIIVISVLGWKLLGHMDTVAQLKATADQTQLDNQKKQTDQLAQNYSDLQKQTAALTAALQNNNQQIQQEIATLTRTLAAQQASDARLSNKDLITRLESLTNQQNLQEHPNGNGVDLTQQQTLTTTQTLEQIPVLQKTVDDQKQQIQNNISQINDLTTENNSASMLLNGFKTELADQQKTCSQEIKAIKIAGVRSKLKWFGAGFVTGFITKLFVHIP